MLQAKIALANGLSPYYGGGSPYIRALEDLI